MKEMWDSFIAWIDETKVITQMKDVDAAGLFTNPWFLVPFCFVVGYLLYKTAWRDLAIVGILMGVWYVSGTPYMKTLVVGNELSMEKILPVVFGGAVTLGVLIYLLFSRD